MIRTTLYAAAVAALFAVAPLSAQAGDYHSPTTTRPAPSAAVAELGRDVRALLRGAGLAARHGVLVVSLDRGDTLFSLRPDEALAPASNLKLFSTAAALAHLGPEFRWSTYLLARGDVRDGVLAGDLVLFGTGDPTLDGWRIPGTARGMEALADSLRARGVREVTGDLVGDGTFFDADLRAAGWTASDLTAWYGAPVAAIIARENLSAPGGRPVDDPVRAAVTRFRAALAARGIRVRGETRVESDAARSSAGFHRPVADGRRPEGRELAAHLSPPLRDVIRVTNHVSHNLYADALLKTVGRVVAGEGSWEGGARVVRAWLAREAGADAARLRVEDGSGLSRLNRVTARGTIQLLARMAEGPLADEFRASLPVAGSERGLRRMADTPAAGNLRAKTGTIRGVSALSGYLTTADGERLAFSIIGNDLSDTGRAKRVEDAVGVRLARFRRR